jgi:hypothetical protein
MDYAISLAMSSNGQPIDSKPMRIGAAPESTLITLFQLEIVRSTWWFGAGPMSMRVTIWGFTVGTATRFGEERPMSVFGVYEANHSKRAHNRENSSANADTMRDASVTTTFS